MHNASFAIQELLALLGELEAAVNASSAWLEVTARGWASLSQLSASHVKQDLFRWGKHAETLQTADRASLERIKLARAWEVWAIV